jgi:ribulose bisphosphate carboxylase small subunit
MLDKIIESYYKKNREARRQYQKEYYSMNSQLIKRKRELDVLLAPEKEDARKAYNQEYYRVNRAAIKARRLRTTKKALSEISING